MQGAGKREVVVEGVREGKERGGHTPGEAARGQRAVRHYVVNAAGGVKHMSVCRRGCRELRGNKKESLLKEEVGKEMPVRGGAGLGMCLMLPHQARVVNAGEPAVAVNAHEEAGPEERAEVEEKGR
eukprot:8949495-Prorocentrum_lima.AAC.1